MDSLSLEVIDMWGKKYCLKGNNEYGSMGNPIAPKSQNFLHLVDKDLGITGENFEVYICKENVYHLVYLTPNKEAFGVVDDYLRIFDLNGNPNNNNSLDFSLKNQANFFLSYQRKKNEYHADLRAIKTRLYNQGIFRDKNKEIEEPHRSYLKRLYGKDSVSNRIINQAFESLGLADFLNLYEHQIRFFCTDARG